jgi:hypothetical protein
MDAPVDAATLSASMGSARSSLVRPALEGIVKPLDLDPVSAKEWVVMFRPHGRSTTRWDRYMAATPATLLDS